MASKWSPSDPNLTIKTREGLAAPGSQAQRCPIGQPSLGRGNHAPGARPVESTQPDQPARAGASRESAFPVKKKTGNAAAKTNGAASPPRTSWFSRSQPRSSVLDLGRVEKREPELLKPRGLRRDPRQGVPPGRACQGGWVSDTPTTTSEFRVLSEE